MNSSSLCAPEAMSLPLAGFSTSSVAPLALSTHEPPMNCWRVVTDSMTSVIVGPPGFDIRASQGSDSRKAQTLR